MQQRPYVGTVGFIVQANCQQDISVATDVSFRVKKPSGAEVTWDASVETVDGNTYYLRHVTDETDLDEPGIYRIHARLTLGVWSGCAEAGTLIVRPLFS